MHATPMDAGRRAAWPSGYLASAQARIAAGVQADAAAAPVDVTNAIAADGAGLATVVEEVQEAEDWRDSAQPAAEMQQQQVQHDNRMQSIAQLGGPAAGIADAVAGSGGHQVPSKPAPSRKPGGGFATAV